MCGLWIEKLKNPFEMDGRQLAWGYCSRRHRSYYAGTSMLPTAGLPSELLKTLGVAE